MMSTGDCVAVSVAAISTVLTIILFIIEKRDKRSTDKAHSNLDEKFRNEYLKSQEKMNNSLSDISKNLLVVAGQLNNGEELTKIETMASTLATELTEDRQLNFPVEILKSIKDFVDSRLSQENQQ